MERDWNIEIKTTVQGANLEWSLSGSNATILRGRTGQLPHITGRCISNWYVQYCTEVQVQGPCVVLNCL